MTVPVWAWITTLAVISPFAHLPITVSLIVIAVIVGCAVAASLWRDRALPCPADEPAGPVAR